MPATRSRTALLAIAALLVAAVGWLLLRSTGILGGDEEPAAGLSSADGSPRALEDEDAALSKEARDAAGRLERLPGIRFERRGTGAIVGKVALLVPGVGEKPLARVVVEAAAVAEGREVRAEATSDDDGTFRIAPAKALAGWVLRARHEPHRDLVVRGLAVEEGQVLDVGTLVFGAPTTLSGSVVDSTGRPIGHALVIVERDTVREGRLDVVRALRSLATGMAGPMASGSSEADGSFALKGLPPGRYLVRVTHPGHAAAFVSGVFVTVDGDSAGVRVVLEPGAGFEGRVLDEQGRGVAGADVVAVPVKTERVVAFEHHETKTDGDGRYRLDTLTSGALYFVEAHAESRAPYGLVRRADGVSSLDISLVVAGRVEGRITDAKSGAGVAGAEILLMTGLQGGGFAPSSTTADADGRYRFEHALPGPLVLLDARASGYARGNLGFDAKAPKIVRAGETLTLDVALSAGGSVRGTVRSDDGTPLAFVSVAAFIAHSTFDGEVATLTDGSGAYRLVGLRPEMWTLAVTAPGYASPTSESEVRFDVTEAGDEKVKDFVLRAGGAVAGHVTTSDRGPASGARVVVAAQDAKRFAASVRDLVAVADATGGYRVSGAPPGVDLVVEGVSDTGVRTRSAAFRVAPGETKTVDLVLRDGQKILGRVVDAAGRGVAKARVRFGHVDAEDLGRLSNSFSADQFLGTRVFLSDAGGGFACDRVPPGVAILRVDADGFSPWFRRDLEVPPESDLAGVLATLEGSKAVAGRVLAADTQRPIAGAWVYAVAKTAQGTPDDQGRVQPLETAETGADGRFTMQGLPPGALEVGVSVCLGYKNSWEDKPNARKDGVPAGSTDLEFRLQPQVPAGVGPGR